MVATLVVPATPVEAALLASLDRLRATCRRLARDPAVADDLFQEACVRALTRPPPDLTADLGPWLDRVAKNLYIDRHRREGRMLPMADPAVHALPPEAPPVVHAAAQRAWVIALARLGPLQRAVFLLRAVMERDTAQTAATLGLSEGAVRVHLHRARKALADGTLDSDLPAQVLGELAAGRVHSFGDLVMLGCPPGGWRQLWPGPGDASVWRALLDLLAVAHEGPDPLARARLRYLHGAVAGQEGRFDDARRDLAEAAALARQEGDRLLLWTVQHERVVIALHGGRPAEAAAALDAVPPASDGPAEAPVLVATARANAAWRAGDVDAAIRHAEAALSLATTPSRRHVIQGNLALYRSQLGSTPLDGLDDAIAGLAHDPSALALMWNTRGMVLQNEGDLVGAEAAFLRAIQECESAGIGGSHRALGNLALVRAEQGRLAEAGELLRDAARRNATSERSQAINLANQGVVAHLAGALRAARELLDGAADLADDTANARLRAFVQAHRALVAERLGGDAAVIWEQARALAHPSQVPLIDTLAGVAVPGPAGDVTLRLARRVRGEARTAP